MTHRYLFSAEIPPEFVDFETAPSEEELEVAWEAWFKNVHVEKEWVSSENMKRWWMSHKTR